MISTGSFLYKPYFIRSQFVIQEYSTACAQNIFNHKSISLFILIYQSYSADKGLILHPFASSGCYQLPLELFFDA